MSQEEAIQKEEARFRGSSALNLKALRFGLQPHNGALHLYTLLRAATCYMPETDWESEVDSAGAGRLEHSSYLGSQVENVPDI